MSEDLMDLALILSRLVYGPTVAWDYHSTLTQADLLGGAAEIIAAGFRRPQESSQTNIAISADASPRPTMDGTLSSASPAEPVKVAGKTE